MGLRWDHCVHPRLDSHQSPISRLVLAGSRCAGEGEVTEEQSRELCMPRRWQRLATAVDPWCWCLSWPDKGSAFAALLLLPLQYAAPGTVPGDGGLGLWAPTGARAQLQMAPQTHEPAPLQHLDAGSMSSFSPIECHGWEPAVHETESLGGDLPGQEELLSWAEAGRGLA